MEKEYKRIVAKDLRLRPQELSDELKCYIKQFIPENNLTEELSRIIDEDSYEFVLRCLLNFKQK